MKLRSKKGFSLVELIIVIAILGIIAVIAVPNLTGIQQRSQVNADIRTAEQIGKAVRIWRTDSASTIGNAQNAVNITSTAWTDYSALTGISAYIATTYTPKSYLDSNKVSGTGRYYVKLVTSNGETETIAVAIGAAPASGNTNNFNINATDNKYDGTAGAPGIAYQEGTRLY